MKQRDRLLSSPRRGLSRSEAAQYVGVSTAKFDQLVADGRMPTPKRIDARRVWDMRALDQAFDDLGSGEVEPNPWDERPTPRVEPSDNLLPPDVEESLRSWREFNKLPEVERRAVLKREYDQWAAVFRKSPLGKKEKAMLDFLCEHMGQTFPIFRTVKSCGQSTLVRLQARGFASASVAGSPDAFELLYFGDHGDNMWATPEGYAAWQEMKALSNPS